MEAGIASDFVDAVLVAVSLLKEADSEPVEGAFALGLCVLARDVDSDAG